MNDTLIVSCGEYTRNLGVLTVEKTGEGLDTLDFRLVPIDETVTEDAAMTAMARRFQQKVDEGYLAGFGLSFDQVLCESAFAFTPIRRFAQQQQEDPLGSLIADSYVYAVEQAEGEDYRTVDFAVVAAGVVRASFAAGEITTSDAFNVSSLGSGADGTPGYPLVSVWLTGRELKDVFEVDASVTPLMPAAQLYPAGMRWTYNPRRLIFNKVTACAQVLPDGSEAALEDERLYRVVTGLYSGQMLGAVNAKSFGILTVTPKDAQGNEITDLEAHIIHTSGGSEVKEWYCPGLLPPVHGHDGPPLCRAGRAQGVRALLEPRPFAEEPKPDHAACSAARLDRNRSGGFSCLPHRDPGPPQALPRGQRLPPLSGIGSSRSACRKSLAAPLRRSGGIKSDPCFAAACTS